MSRMSDLFNYRVTILQEERQGLEPVLWHSILSLLLQHWHPMWVLVLVLAAPLSLQFPAIVPGKAVMIALTLGTYMGEQEEAHSPHIRQDQL